MHEPEFGHFCRIPSLGVSSFSFYGFGEKTFTRLAAVYSSTYLVLRVLYFHSSSIFSLHRTSRVRDRSLARFAASFAVSSLVHPTVNLEYRRVCDTGHEQRYTFRYSRYANGARKSRGRAAIEIDG